MAEISNTAKVLNTFVNPLTTATWTPDWFKPLSSKYPEQNAVLFHAAALLATYGALGYGVRAAKSLMPDNEYRQKIQKAIKSNVDADTPLLNPDPDINDDESLPGIYEKTAGDNTVDVTRDVVEAVGDMYPTALNMGGLFIPALAAYTAYMYGHKKGDEYFDNQALERNEKIINKLENIYEKANMQRLLAAKGKTPAEITELETSMTPIYKTAASETAELASSTLPNMTPDISSSDPIVKGAKLIGMLGILGLGGVSYASYKLAQEYLDDQDPEKRKAKAIKKALERELASRKPTALVPDFDPRLGKILNAPADRKKLKASPIVDELPAMGPGSLADLLNTA